MDDIWTQHEDLIKDLYQTKRKTLRQIKQELESNHSFPVHALSIYEVRLRALGLHKKLKKEHWPLVYKELCARGDPEFRNSGVYLNRTLIPRAKAWKEIRRSGARAAAIDTNGTLPAWITVKTMSHPGVPQPILHLSSAATNELQREPSSTTAPVALAANSNRPTMNASTLKEFVQLQTESLPLNECMHKLFELQISESEAISSLEYEMTSTVPFSVVSKDGFNRGSIFRLLGSYRHSIFSTPTTNTLSTRFDFFYLMSKVIYLVSNKHFKLHSNDLAVHELSRASLDIIINRIPRRVLWNFFRLDILSVRAVWEVFADFDMLKNRKDRKDEDYDNPKWHSRCVQGIPGFALFLIDVALVLHPEWAHGRNACHLLCLSAVMGELDRVQRLLDIGVCINTAEAYPRVTPIMVATLQPFPKCVRLLIKNCNLNPISRQAAMEQRQPHKGPSCSFTNFIRKIREDEIHSTDQLSSPRQYLDHDKSSNFARRADQNNFLNTFELFLKAGVDVDQPFPLYLTHYSMTSKFSKFYQDSNTPTEWLPTCLDMVFYAGMPFFELAKGYSKRYRQGITRSGISAAASQGILDLNQYMRSKSKNWKADTQKYLELILLEQLDRGFLNIFTAGERSLTIANSLIQFGVAICPQHFHLHEDLSSLLVSLITKETLRQKDEIYSLMRHLVQKGAVIDSNTLAAAVEVQGTGLLELLVGLGANVAADGALALATAARRKNYEAVSWLLQSGVDVNAEISLRHTRSKNVEIYTVLGAACFHAWAALDEISERSSGNGLEFHMFCLLINAKARVSLKPSDPSPYRLLRAITAGCHPLTVDNFRSFPASCQPELQKMTIVDWRNFIIYTLHPANFLWEETQKIRLELAEMVLRRHCPSEAAHLLSPFIAAGARDELIQELIHLEADIHMSIKDMDSLQAAASRCKLPLASQLLDMGANVNPRAKNQKSALSLICMWNAVSADEESRKRALIELLLQKGATVDLNHGSALRSCVLLGEMENVILLLEHGANPNLNNPDFVYPITALDEAQSKDRFDIAKLLLNIGAISGIPGSTGYDGALNRAKHGGPGAIAELIRRHITENEKRFCECPSLQIAHAALIKEVEQRRRGRTDWISDENENGE